MQHSYLLLFLIITSLLTSTAYFILPGLHPYGFSVYLILSCCFISLHLLQVFSAITSQHYGKRYVSVLELVPIFPLKGLPFSVVQSPAPNITILRNSSLVSRKRYLHSMSPVNQKEKRKRMEKKAQRALPNPVC